VKYFFYLNKGLSMKKPLIFAAILILTSLLYARTSYIGYSGAPGTPGTCAFLCHGTFGGGTIQIDGFPDEYVPLQTYEITIFHTGGLQISQFNGSCRVGFTAQNAGLISAGTNTETYDTGGETNGIHFSTTYLDTAIFIWTAPHAGAGEVRLYVAGQQGNENGNNTILVLVASEQQSDVEGTTTPHPAQFALYPAYPNPFNASTVLTYDIVGDSRVTLSIYDINGNLVTTVCDGFQSAGQHQVTWDASKVASGIYFCQLSTTGFQSVQKIVLIK
jgi:hypothetical protein